MKKIILFLLLTISILAQEKSTLPLMGGKGYYLYTPVTGSATVSEDMVQISGSETRTKSNKTDTLATKRSPQRWMVWDGTVASYISDFSDVSSFDGFYPDTIGSKVMLSDGTIGDSIECLITNVLGRISYEGSILSQTNSNLINSVRIRFDKFTGEEGYAQLDLIGIEGTDTVFNISDIPCIDGVWETIDTTFSISKSNNEFTKIQFSFGYNGNDYNGQELGIKNVVIEFSIVDSSQGLSKILYDLPEDVEFTYYHSILVFTTDNDTDYYKGDDSTFTTMLIPPSDLTAEADTGKINLIWIVNSLNADSVHIERKLFNEPEDSFAVIANLLSTEATYLDSPLVNRGTYSYRIRNSKTNYSVYSDTTSSYVEEWIPVLDFSPSTADFGLQYWADSSLASIDTSSATIDDYDYSTIASIDTIEVIDPISYPDSVDFTTIADIDTTLGSSYTANILGLTGANLNDFPYRNSAASNTFTLDNGWYNLFFDPDTNSTAENNYGIRGFTTPSNDSLFFGCRLFMTSDLESWVGADEVNIFFLRDTVDAGTFFALMADDGSATNAYNRWRIHYNNTTNQNVLDADAFALGDTLSIQVSAYINAGAGAYNVYVDGSLIASYTSVTNTAYVPNSLIFGNYQPQNDNDVARTGEILMDNFYIDTTAVANEWWVATASTYDTTFAYWYIDTTLAYWAIDSTYQSGGGSDTILITVYNNNTVAIAVDSIYISGDDTPFTYDAFAETISAKDSSSFNIYASIDTVGAWNKSLIVVQEYIDQYIGLVLTSTSLDSIPPDIPTDILLTGANRSANLSWTNGAESGNKYILWALNNETDLVIGDSVESSATSFNITGLDSGSVYRAGLMAYDANYNLTDTSATDTALIVGTQTIDTTPPTGLTSITAVGNSDGTITITATQGGDLSDVYSYTIMRSIENPSFTALSQISHPRPSYDSVLASTNLSSTTFTYTDNSVNRGSVYSYKVGNWDASGNGNWWSTTNDTALVPLSIIDTTEVETGIARFVSLDGGSPYDGLTWATAYNYPSIPFATLPTNTILYFDGGTDSVIYNSALTIGGSNVTLTKGTSAEHNGRVIFRSPTTQSGTGISITNRQNVRIMNFEFDGWDFGIDARGTVVNGIDSILVQNNRFSCYSYAFYTQGGYTATDSAGNNSHDIFIYDNYIEQPLSGSNADVQIDGISYKCARNIFVIGNTFINRDTQVDDSHSDFVEGQWNTNQYYFNNFFYIENNTTVGQNGVQHGGNSAGDFYFVNNIFMMGQYTTQSAIWSELFGRTWGNMRVVNNTFIGANPRFLYLGGYPKAVIKNNLFWNTRTMGSRPSFIYVEAEDGETDELVVENNNFYYNGTQVYMVGTNTPARPVSNGWYLETTYTPTLTNFTVSPETYTNCPYTETPSDYYVTSSSTREWGQGETLLEADFPTHSQAPAWFKVWDYIERDVYHIGASEYVLLLNLSENQHPTEFWSNWNDDWQVQSLPDRAMIVNNPVSDAVNSSIGVFKSEIRFNDDYTGLANGAPRCELQRRNFVYEDNKLYEYGFKTLLPADWIIETNDFQQEMILNQLYESPTFEAPCLNIRGERYYVDATGATKYYLTDSLKYDLGKWVEWKWVLNTSTTTPNITLYKNGVEVFNEDLDVLPDGSGTNYNKFGAYKWDWQNYPLLTNNTGSIIIYYDDIWIKNITNSINTDTTDFNPPDWYQP